MLKLAIGTLFILSALIGNANPAGQRIAVRAHRFEYVPNEISVKKGTPVTLILHSEDVTHGLLIKQLGIKEELHKGKSEEITFTPQQTGTFEGQCNHFCGVGHGQMRFTIHVTE